MLDQLNAFPHNVQLRCRCVYHLLDGWKGTRDSGESALDYDFFLELDV